MYLHLVPLFQIVHFSCVIGRNTAVTIWKTTLISSRDTDLGVTRVTYERVDDRKRKPDRRISIYDFSLFLLFSWYFYHVFSLSLSLSPLSSSSNHKNQLTKYFEDSYDHRFAKQFNGTSENVCARNQISITSDWILVRDGVIRGFPNVPV